MIFEFGKEKITARSDSGIPMGMIRFPRVRAGLVNIDQIIVYSEFRDLGVEEQMMDALLPHLLQTHQKAVLSCPAVQQYVSRHEEWKQILPGSIHFTTH